MTAPPDKCPRCGADQSYQLPIGMAYVCNTTWMNGQIHRRDERCYERELSALTNGIVRLSELVNDAIAFEAELLTLLNVRPREDDYDADDRTRIVEAVKAQDPRFHKFGEAMWRYITSLGGDFCGAEISEDILPLARDAGLCLRVAYDPAIHGEDIEADPGDEIWWWGDSLPKPTETSP